MSDFLSFTSLDSVLVLQHGVGLFAIDSTMMLQQDMTEPAGKLLDTRFVRKDVVTMHEFPST